jgi:ABC-type lipoprotein release transport system permease subunit
MVSGHVVAQPAGYPISQVKHPVDDLLEITPDRAARLDGLGGIWTRRILFSPTAIHGAASLRVRAIGFDPARDPEVFPRGGWKVAGAAPPTGGAAGEGEPSSGEGVWIGTGVARLLELDVGDELVLQVRTMPGALNAERVRVAGVVSSGNPWLDRMGVLVPMARAESLVQAPGRASHVVVRLPQRSEASAQSAADALAAALGPDAEVHTWMAEVEDLVALQRVRQKALNLIVFALLAMAATGIANTILMAAWERVREIGTLQAMGMTRPQVVGLFVAEGALLGLVGAGIGGAGGLAIVGWYGAHGIDLAPALEKGGAVGANIPISSMLYLALDPFWAVAAPAMGVAIAVAASVYPARVASALPPAEAVRA